MRLLISGSKQDFVLSNFLTKHFDESVQFDVLSFHDTFNEMMKHKMNRAFFHFFPTPVIHQMNKIFLHQVDEFQPDLVLVFKGMEISKEALAEVGRRGIILVNYNLDHPYFFENRGSGNRFVKEAIPYYDLHITYSLKIQGQLKKKFNIPTALLPFGYELPDDVYAELPSEDRKRVCFVGNADNKRADLINFLASKNLAVDVYGSGWNKLLRQSKCLTIFPQVVGHRFWETLRRYRVQLNILRKQNEDSHNMRSFEIPGAGGLMLAPDTVEHKLYFHPEREIFLYRDFESCLKKCKDLLDLRVEEANEIRASARKRSEASGYSYKNRAKALVEILKGTKKIS
jgi:spore maturation protein CgeB